MTLVTPFSINAKTPIKKLLYHVNREDKRRMIDVIQHYSCQDGARRLHSDLLFSEISSIYFFWLILPWPYFQFNEYKTFYLTKNCLFFSFPATYVQISTLTINEAVRAFCELYGVTLPYKWIRHGFYLSSSIYIYTLLIIVCRLSSFRAEYWAHQLRQVMNSLWRKCCGS